MWKLCAIGKLETHRATDSRIEICYVFLSNLTQKSQRQKSDDLSWYHGHSRLPISLRFLLHIAVAGFKTNLHREVRSVSFGSSDSHDLLETEQSSCLKSHLRLQAEGGRNCEHLKLVYRPIAAIAVGPSKKIRFGPIVSVGRLRVVERVTACYHVRESYLLLLHVGTLQKPFGSPNRCVKCVFRVAGPKHINAETKMTEA